jgi:hypothetical protein
VVAHVRRVERGYQKSPVRGMRERERTRKAENVRRKPLGPVMPHHRPLALRSLAPSSPTYSVLLTRILPFIHNVVEDRERRSFTQPYPRGSPVTSTSCVLPSAQPPSLTIERTCVPTTDGRKNTDRYAQGGKQQARRGGGRARARALKREEAPDGVSRGRVSTWDADTSEWCCPGRATQCSRQSAARLRCAY